MPKTFYDRLGVDSGADSASIDAAFRTASAVASGAERLSAAVRLAFGVLSVPEQRETYDEMLEFAECDWPRKIDRTTARLYRLAATPWGFRFKERGDGALLTHVGAPDKPAPYEVDDCHDARPDVALYDPGEELAPQKPALPSYEPRPVALGQAVFHWQRFYYRVTDAVYTSSKLQLHIDDAPPNVFDLPEMAGARGVRPGCDVMFLGMANLSREQTYYFTGAAFSPYDGRDQVRSFAIHGRINNWFDQVAARTAMGRRHKKTDPDLFSRTVFDTPAKNNRALERTIRKFESASWEALFRSVDAWTGQESNDALIQREVEALVPQRLKNVWGLGRGWF